MSHLTQLEDSFNALGTALVSAALLVMESNFSFLTAGLHFVFNSIPSQTWLVFLLSTDEGL